MQQRRQCGLKSGGRGSGSKKFIFPGKISVEQLGISKTQECSNLQICLRDGVIKFLLYWYPALQIHL